MNSKQRLMPIILIFFSVISVVYFNNTKMENNQIYNDLLEKARDEAKHDIVVDADADYMKLMDMNANKELAFEIASFYLDKGFYDKAFKWYQGKLLIQYSDLPETYVYGIRVGTEAKDYKKVFTVYDTYTRRGFHSDEIEELMEPVKYTFYLGSSYDYVYPFNNDSDFTVVRKDEGRWGILEYTDRQTTTYKYEMAGNLINDLIPVVDEEGNAMFVDYEGNLKVPSSYFEEADPNFGKVKQFKDVRQGIIPAFNGTIWNYYSYETHEKLFGGFRDATVIAGGIGAVTKDGIKWAFIGRDGKLITEYIFDEVVTNSEGEVGENGVVMASQGGQYYLYDVKGKQISTTGYDEVNAFCEDTYASVRKGDKWLFIDAKGKEHDLGDYKEAQSFSHGLAGVRGDKGWGFIDLEGNLVIDYQFEEVQPVSKHGVTNVFTDEYWQILTFYKDNYDRI